MLIFSLDPGRQPANTAKYELFKRHSMSAYSASIQTSNDKFRMSRVRSTANIYIYVFKSCLQKTLECLQEYMGVQ